MSETTHPWYSSYAPGVPQAIDVPDETLNDMIDTAVARFGSNGALEFFGRVLSYRQLGAEIARTAEGLRQLGVVPGDRVAIVLPNCPQHVIAFYAVLRLGAIVVEQNPLYTEDELQTLFADHGARVAIAWDRSCATLAAVAETTDLETIVAVDMTRAMPFATRSLLALPIAAARAKRALLTVATPEGTLSWSQLRGHGMLSTEHPRPVHNDIAVIQYTSGTTGTPKGAMLSHRNLRANAAQGRAWVPGLNEGSEVFYGVLPLFHVYGLTLCLTFAMSIGARLVLFPTFAVDLVLTAMRKHACTFLPAVPPIYDQLSRTAVSRGVDMTSIRFSISGAMGLPAETVARWEQVTGGLLVEGYGMTEASPIVVGNPISGARRPGSIGIPFPSTDAQVVDPDEPSRMVGPGERGELLVRGPQVFGGYWGKPEETATTLTADGWLRTGDIVTMSSDGFFTIVDRIKELIVTGGFNVSPSEVEQTVRQFPGVEDVAVVGLPRRIGGGEDVAAAVVMQGGIRLDAAALRTFCRQKLVSYKVPKKIIEVTELPRSMMGKVLRRHVRESVFGR